MCSEKILSNDKVEIHTSFFVVNFPLLKNKLNTGISVFPGITANFVPLCQDMEKLRKIKPLEKSCEL